MKPLRIEARFRNNILWHLIFDHFRSVSELCRFNPWLGGQERIGSLLNLKTPIKNKDGSYVLAAEKLAGLFRMLVEDVFPDDLYKQPAPDKLAFEIPFSQLSKHEVLSLPQPPASENQTALELLHEQLNKVLHTLPPREQEVLKMRFGLGNNQPAYLEEVSEHFNVTRERIRQIEAKALRRLRHPKRTTRLKDYLEWASEDRP